MCMPDMSPCWRLNPSAYNTLSHCAPNTLIDYIQVGQKHPHDPFDNESTDQPKMLRNRCEQYYGGPTDMLACCIFSWLTILFATFPIAPSPMVVMTESFDSPPTVTSGPLEKNPFMMDEDEEDYLLPESTGEEFLFKGMFEDVDITTGFQTYFLKVKASHVYIKHTDQALYVCNMLHATLRSPYMALLETNFCLHVYYDHLVAGWALFFSRTVELNCRICILDQIHLPNCEHYSITAFGRPWTSLLSIPKSEDGWM